MRPQHLATSAIILCCLPGLAPPARAAACDPAADRDCAREQVHQLRTQGQTRAAITFLKAALARAPDSVELALLLAQTYLDENNLTWAARTLGEFLARHPTDCDASAWLGWLQMQQGLVLEARDTLAQAQCERDTPSATRIDVLLAMVARQLGDPGLAAHHMLSARQAPLAFPEDHRALAEWASQDAGFVVPLTGRFELGLGWAANALAGSPVDPTTARGDLSSLAGQLGGWLRFVVPTAATVKPALELDGRSLGYTSAMGRNFSYLSLGARPGLLFGRRANMLLAYRFEETLLAGGDRYDDGPNWFYDAHRAETEIGLSRSLSAFAGIGRRTFRESGRSRWEIDGGLGGGTMLGAGSTQLLAALLLRWHDADKAPYDLRGGSLLVSAERRLPRGWSVRLGAFLGLDDYVRSAGYFDASAPDKERRDLLLRASAGGFAPPVADGLRVGLHYEHALRMSTAQPYDYRDQRILLKLLWTFSHDPWLPRRVSRENHIPLDYGFARAGFSDRIQDLLRQDEAAQRSSSCVK